MCQVWSNQSHKKDIADALHILLNVWLKAVICDMSTLNVYNTSVFVI